MATTRFKETLKTLRAAYGNELPVQLEEVKTSWRELEEEWNTEKLEKLYLMVHTLGGNASTFGFNDISSTVRPLEMLLKQMQERGTPATPGERDSFRKQFGQLMKKSRAPQEAETQAFVPDLDAESEPNVHDDNGDRKLVYIVDDDIAVCRYLALQIEQYGYQVRFFQTVEQFSKGLKERVPDALIMDIMLAEGELAGPKLVRAVQKTRDTRIPVIFVSGRVDMQARLAAVRANGDAYFKKPVNVQTIVEKLNELTSEANVLEKPRILIIDETNAHGEQYKKILSQSDMIAHLLKDPMQIMVALKKTSPELIMISSKLTRLSSVELAMVIRQQEEYEHLPIIFFAQDFEQTLRRKAMRGVADEFISEDISPGKLIALVSKRVKHTRQQRPGATSPQDNSNRDPMTGLYNRQYLMAHLDMAGRNFDKYQLMGVLYINLDSYRGIDKIMGLAASDSLIVETAHLLSRRISKRDVLARIGDSVFVILSFNRSLAAIQRLAETVRESVERQMVSVAGQRVTTTCSIGISLYRSQDTSPEQTLLSADQACIEAQELGGNQVCLHDSAQNAMLDEEHKAHWQKTIINALESDKFFLVYQPIANLHGTPGQYYDVLLRMSGSGNDTEEHVAPSEFLPMAEQFGLMDRIDRWVIKQAIINSMYKHHEEQDVNLFIRISGASLGDEGLLSWVEECLKAAQLPFESVIFDLAQADVKNQLKKIDPFVLGVRKLGCRITLRDFDESADAFQLFRLLNADFVKITSSLVKGLSNNARNLKAIQTIVQRVHQENKLVIAPFVEDAGSLSLLWNNNIDYIAGQFVQAPSDGMDYDFR